MSDDNYSQKHLFIIDPLDKLNFKLDSSIRMAFELNLCGAEVYVCEDKDLYWNIKDPSASCHSKKVCFGDKGPTSIKVESEKSLLLEEFHGIHMRKEPPFNIDYVSCTWLLDSAVNKSWIFNEPNALRTINEKLSLFLFPEASKKALVSSSSKDLYEFAKSEANGDAIVKPLDLFGGRGIFRLETNNEPLEKSMAKLDEATSDSKFPRLIQPFDSKIHDGEVRVFTLGGKAISWCLKKPKEGNFMANTSQGAKLERYQPAPKMKEMIENVAMKLVGMGIYIAGFDVIGDSISEINVTSPRLLQADDDKENYYQTMARWFYEKCGKRPSVGSL